MDLIQLKSDNEKRLIVACNLNRGVFGKLTLDFHEEAFILAEKTQSA